MWWFKQAVSASWQIAAVGIVAIAGCGGPTGPKVYPVSGVVLRNGVPLVDVSVQFRPESGRPSTAATDSSGKFVLEYEQGKRGALKGSHTVLVDEKFQGGTADGVTPTRAVSRTEPKSYRLSTPVQVKEESNSFKIDVTAGTVTVGS
ncbi:MAG: hypothetical protein V4719_06915 [Planctomycetota bacterium]